jgi:hypothetical protein
MHLVVTTIIQFFSFGSLLFHFRSLMLVGLLGIQLVEGELSVPFVLPLLFICLVVVIVKLLSPPDWTQHFRVMDFSTIFEYTRRHRIC